MQSAQTWQEAWWAYGKMVSSAQEDACRRMLDMTADKLNAEEFTRMVLDKPLTFARSVELASRAAEASRGQVATGAAKPDQPKTTARADVKRLSKNS